LFLVESRSRSKSKSRIRNLLLREAGKRVITRVVVGGGEAVSFGKGIVRRRRGEIAGLYG
jgi:hypothetical protein